MKLPVVVGACKGCCFCIMACPVGAAGPLNPKKVVADKCVGCGKCVKVCPNNARELREA